MNTFKLCLLGVLFSLFYFPYNSQSNELSNMVLLLFQPSHEVDMIKIDESRNKVAQFQDDYVVILENFGTHSRITTKRLEN